MNLRLAEIRDLAYRFVPAEAADERLYRYGPRSWWPAHEIGHFLVATSSECREAMFGIDGFDIASRTSSQYRYILTKELAATSISQRLLRRAGHVDLADQEIQYTDEDTLACSFERWCRRSVRGLLREHRLLRLPATFGDLERLLSRKARAVGTTTYPSKRAAERNQP